MLAQPRRGIAELAGDVITYSGPAALVALLLSMLVAIRTGALYSKAYSQVGGGHGCYVAGRVQPTGAC